VRIHRLVALLVTLLAYSTTPRLDPKAEPVSGPAVAPAKAPPGTGHGAGRDRWRGGGVYLDGQPIGVLRHAELPVDLKPVWETQRRRLPFRAGEPIQYRESQVRRYRVTDYLRAVGVPLDRIVEVHLHGARDAAIVLTRDVLLRHPDDILFKFAGETFGKPIPIVRSIQTGTSFDDLAALTIYIDRKPPRLTRDHSLELDGIPVHGIPYYGEPLREGVRVYLDNRLVAVLKRNQLISRNNGRWSLGDVLEREGVATSRIARLELIHDESRTAKLAWGQIEFAFNPAASGEVVLDAELPANSIALFTRG
jgi:hypothetical protein